ncbi:MAG: RnfABCDGE type electron transport complex subunit D, partial [Planctomycetota bacterium]
MSSEAPRFVVGTAPHWRSRTSIAGTNYAFMLALAPAALVGAIAYSFGSKAVAMTAGTGPLAQVIKVLVEEMGMNAGVLWFLGTLGIVLLGIGMGILTEYLCQMLMRQPYHVTNGHGALMGMILALLMPPTAPWWLLVIGVVVAIFVGKQIFGGIGGYPMHPAIVGWLVLLLSWPGRLYPVDMGSICAAHVAPIIATAAGGLALLALGYIRWQIPTGVILGVVIFGFILGGDLDGNVADQLLTGHVLLAAFFLSTDSTCSPVNKLAMWIYGLGTGLLIILIRAYGIWPDAVPFAVLLMNILFPLLDRIRPRVKEVVIQDG